MVDQVDANGQREGGRGRMVEIKQTKWEIVQLPLARYPKRTSPWPPSTPLRCVKGGMVLGAVCESNLSHPLAQTNLRPALAGVDCY